MSERKPIKIEAMNVGGHTGDGTVTGIETSFGTIFITRSADDHAINVGVNDKAGNSAVTVVIKPDGKADIYRDDPKLHQTSTQFGDMYRAINAAVKTGHELSGSEQVDLAMQLKPVVVSNAINPAKSVGPEVVVAAAKRDHQSLGPIMDGVRAGALEEKNPLTLTATLQEVKDGLQPFRYGNVSVTVDPTDLAKGAVTVRVDTNGDGFGGPDDLKLQTSKRKITQNGKVLLGNIPENVLKDIADTAAVILDKNAPVDLKRIMAGNLGDKTLELLGRQDVANIKTDLGGGGRGR